MKIFLSILCLVTYSSTLLAVKITEENYQGTPHFVIKTKTAVYYLDKRGGGLSAMLDKKGRDWITFKKNSGKIASLRTIPGFVKGENDEDRGVGLPGFDKCYSFKVDNHTILTISKNGKWQWRWKFYNKYARVTIEKIAPGEKYWFLYRGTIAGNIKPEQEYWGNNLGGPRNDISDLLKGKEILGNWLWAYFGDKTVKGVLYVAMVKPDRYLDSFAYLTGPGVNGSGDGMAVFSFGRHSNEPQLTRRNNSFIFGFIWERVKNQSRHDSVKKELHNIFKSLPQ